VTEAVADRAVSQATPRGVALQILRRVEATEAYANLLLDARLRAVRLSRPDRALATELVYGVLRWRGRLDWHLEPVLDRPLAELDAAVRWLLRLGAYQLTALSRVPAFAAVDESVRLARAAGAGRSAGYVNAVLRTLTRRPPRPEPDPAADPLGHWSGPGSHPAWLVRRWLERLGPSEAAALMAANNGTPPVTLLTNRLRATPEAVAERLRPAAPELAPCGWVPGAFTIRGGGSPGELPGFAEGLVIPMDEAGALPVLALELAEGQSVLDACAGGGGKSALIAAAIGPGGRLLALDSSPRAIRRLQTALTRLGVATAETRQADAREAAAAWPERFPRVLVDAPCSGLGTLRRRPEIKWRRRPEDLARAARLQGELLTGAAGAVQPGGLLVYSTCSLEPEETDMVVDAFLAARPAFALEAAGPLLAPFADPGRPGLLRAWPHRHGTDGFFVARLRREG
jgi:16S rRNA (cytosine967-C5)-methyltransferase